MINLNGRALVAAVLLIGVVACGDSAAPRQGEQSAVPQPTQDAATEEQTLDLSRDALRDAMDDVDADELADREDLLPDLFEQTPQEKNTKLSGKVLTNEEGVNLVDSVDGVEVRLEMKTN